MANPPRADVSVVFDGSFDGFLCVVHAYYHDRVNPLHIQTEALYQQTLDAEPYYVATDAAKATTVFAAIRAKISEDAARHLYNAALSGEGGDDKYGDMLTYAALGFKMGAGTDAFLQHDAVRRVQRLSRRVASEAHLLSGFCRFAETRQGVYYCAITPKNYVLALLAEHFRDRFMNQAWVIHDKKHGLAAVYDKTDYVICETPAGVNVAFSDAESEIQEEWVTFFTAIGIQARVSYQRQRRVMPLRYRGNMLEFAPRPAPTGAMALTPPPR